MKWGKKPLYNSIDGAWSEIGFESETICRATPAGSGSTVYNAGLNLEYSFNIAFPKNLTSLPQGGDEIEIYSTKGVKIFEGILIRIHFGSASIRAWA